MTVFSHLVRKDGIQMSCSSKCRTYATSSSSTWLLCCFRRTLRVRSSRAAVVIEVQDSDTGDHIASCPASCLCNFQNLRQQRFLESFESFQLRLPFFWTLMRALGRRLCYKKKFRFRGRFILLEGTRRMACKPRKRGGAWMDDCLGRSKARHCCAARRRRACLHRRCRDRQWERSQWRT